MRAAPAVAPVLVIGIGNPSRGDDALGPRAIERLEAMALPHVEALTDFQLAPEHALDMIGRELVVFVDASVQGDEPFRCEPVTPAHDDSATSHALSPAAVLDTYVHVTRLPLPECRVFAIRGHAFDLGSQLSGRATANLDLALAELVARIEAFAHAPA